MILLNPGPVNLSARVRRALAGPDICHREPEFSALQGTVRSRLLEVYGLDPGSWAAVMLSGSGTCAVEAMITSLVPADGHLVVVENGVYGERMARIAAVHGISCTTVSFDWGAEIRLPELERALDDGPRATHVAVVHHETTTGRLNPLGPIGTLCGQRGVALLVDGVSSFGAEEIRFEEWTISACAAAAGKCLHGAPGQAFVVARRAALEAGCSPPRTLYLDLPGWCREQDLRSTPFTPAIPAIYALREALEEFFEQGGVAARRERYRRLAESVRSGLGEQGILPYLPPEASSVVLRSYNIPAGLRYEDLHDGLRGHDFVIYAGQQRLKDRLFRVATMGEIGPADIDRLLVAFRSVVRAHPSSRGREAP